MTREEAIYCMNAYLPENTDNNYCAKCPYYATNTEDECIAYCNSSEAHRLAIKALEQISAIEKIIDSPLYIQEYVLRYKMICDALGRSHV